MGRAAGVYPRVGGGNPYSSGCARKARGLSPRGRGKRVPATGTGRRRRSIPAWAGETGPPAANPGPARVYPRVGGGNWTSSISATRCRGLSPRGRGKPAFDNGADRLPAVYPRVGGGNGSKDRNPIPGMGLSPRGRGKPFSAGETLRCLRSIPAWAGETASSLSPPLRFPVYPRVGGGNLDGGGLRGLRRGLSPRGRGKPGAARPLHAPFGSIPAWAGETAALAGFG